MDITRKFFFYICLSFSCISINIIDTENWFNWFYSSKAQWINELGKWMKKPLKVVFSSLIFNLSFFMLQWQMMTYFDFILIPFSTNIHSSYVTVLIYYSVNIILFHSTWKPSNSYTHRLIAIPHHPLLYH